MWARRLIIVFLLGMGAWTLHFGVSEVRVAKSLEHHAAETPGRVVGSASRELNKGGMSLQLEVEYTPPGHPTITKTFDVDSSDYRAGREKGMVTVTYSPEDPQVSRVTAFALLPFYGLIGLGGLMVLGGGVCLLIAPRGQRSR